jgi:hypothetical protein
MPSATDQAGRRGRPGGRPSPCPFKWWSDSDWIVLAPALPLLAALVRVVAYRRDTFVSGDLAMLHLDAIRASRFAQLVGPYDRFGWDHPGPFYAYLMAIGKELVGARYPLQAEAFTAACINGAALAGAVLVARRIGGWRVGLALSLVAVALTAAWGNQVVLDPWNPLVSIAPLVLLGVLAAAAALGSATALAAGTVVASFVVQTDVGTLPYALALLGGGGVLLLWECYRTQTALWPSLRSGAARPGLLLVGLAVLAWVPPGIQEVFDHPGNLGQIVSFFTSGRPRAGWGAGLKAAGRGQFQITGYRPSAVHLPRWGAWLAGAGAEAGAVLVLLAHRAGAPVAELLGAIWVGGTVVGVIAGADIVGAPYWYLMVWMTACVALGLAGWLSLGLGLLARPGLRVLRIAPGLVVVGVAALVGWRTDLSAYSSRPVADAWRLVAPLAAAPRPLGLAFPNTAVAWSVGAGLADRVAAGGGSFRVPPMWSSRFGAADTGPARRWVDLIPAGTTPAGPARRLGTVDGLELVVTSRPVVLAG